MSRTRWRGLSEENGSWNTGWIRRAVRVDPCRRGCGHPPATSPSLGGSRPRTMRASVDLPQPEFADDAKHVAGRQRERHAVDRAHHAFGAIIPARILNIRRTLRTSTAWVMHLGPRPVGRQAAEIVVIRAARSAWHLARALLDGVGAAVAESAADEIGRNARHHAGNAAQRFVSPRSAGHRNAAQQAACIRMCWRGEQLPRPRFRQLGRHTSPTPDGPCERRCPGHA